MIFRVLAILLIMIPNVAWAWVGGSLDKSNRFSFVVRVYVEKVGGCSGTAMSKRIVITAAHCFLGMKRGANVFVDVVRNDLVVQHLSVRKFKASSEYDVRTSFGCAECAQEDMEKHDIAIVTTDEDLQITDFPALLFNYLDSEHLDALRNDRRMSWSTLTIFLKNAMQFNGNNPRISVVGFAACASGGCNKRKYLDMKLQEVRDCYLSTRDDFGGDTWCYNSSGFKDAKMRAEHGDSGGPAFMIDKEGHLVLIGILSTFDISSSILVDLPFIEQNTRIHFGGIP